MKFRLWLLVSKVSGQLLYYTYIQCSYGLDLGMPYFLAGFPRWTPIPAVTRAYMARSRVWWSLVEYHKALDAFVDGKPLGSAWGDLEDVSPFIMARHKLFKG